MPPADEVADVLFAMMHRFTVITLLVPLLRIPPALPEVLLFATIKSSSVMVPASFWIAPPELLLTVLTPLPPVSLIPLRVTFEPATDRNMRLALFPLIVSRYAPGPIMDSDPLLAPTSSPLESVMVCGDENSGTANATISLSAVPFAAVTASRREQSASHTPSFVSAIFVTMYTAAGTECADHNKRNATQILTTNLIIESSLVQSDIANATKFSPTDYGSRSHGERKSCV